MPWKLDLMQIYFDESTNKSEPLRKYWYKRLHLLNTVTSVHRAPGSRTWQRLHTFLYESLIGWFTYRIKIPYIQCKKNGNIAISPQATHYICRKNKSLEVSVFGHAAHSTVVTQKTHLFMTYISNKAGLCSIVASLSMYSSYIREVNLPSLQIMIFQRS